MLSFPSLEWVAIEALYLLHRLTTASPNLWMTNASSEGNGALSASYGFLKFWGPILCSKLVTLCTSDLLNELSQVSASPIMTLPQKENVQGDITNFKIFGPESYLWNKWS